MKEGRVPLLELFLSYFDRQVLEDLFRGVADTYPTTARHLRENWSDSEGIDLRPHIQRANVIRSVRAVGEKHRPRGVEPKDVFNASRTSRNIMLVGGRGSLTPHYIPSKQSSVRSAVYRRMLCSPNVLDLFALEAVAADTPLHAFLVHGCDGLRAYERVGREKPDFVYIRFPIVESGVYAAQSLDLMELFPNVLGQNQSTAVDHVIEIEDEAMPKLRPAQKTGEAG
jgi:hypothetical protein